MRRKLRIAFTDLWSDAEATRVNVRRLLEPWYDVEVVEQEPEVVFFSVFGKNHRRYRCKKVLYSGENFRIRLNECDFAFSMRYIDNPRHQRLPHFVLYDHYCRLAPVDRAEILRSIEAKTRFCTMVVSNRWCKQRIRFFHLLNEAKRVDSGGRFMNNIGGPVEDKLAFVSEGRFHIAFENESYPGYVTEKITGALSVGSVPIYWGSPRIAEDIDPGCFVNAHDYESLNSLVDAVLRVECDSEAYEQIATAPRFPGDRLPEAWSYGGLSRKLHDIVESPVVHHSLLARWADRFLCKCDYLAYMARRLAQR